MAEYFWVPLDDTAIDQWATSRAAQKMASVLPRRANHNDYPPNTNRQGLWSSLCSYDSIFICCHGVATSLSKVGWATGAGVVKWNAEQLANMFIANLQVSGHPLANIWDIHLTACWGANRFTPLTSSFGKKLADELKKAGCGGRLTAYQGATSLNPYGDFQTGSSRMTSGLLYWKNINVFNSQTLATNKKRNRLGVRAAYKKEDAEVFWNLA